MCQVRKCARVRLLINTVNTFLRTPQRDWRKEIPVVEQRDISVNFYLPHVELHLTYLLFLFCIILYIFETSNHSSTWKAGITAFPVSCGIHSISHFGTLILMYS